VGVASPIRVPSRPPYSIPTEECLKRKGLSSHDLDEFVGMDLAAAHASAARKGLTLFEAMVDGEPRFRIMILNCNWITVEVRNGKIERVHGLG